MGGQFLGAKLEEPGGVTRRAVHRAGRGRDSRSGGDSGNVCVDRLERVAERKDVEGGGAVNPKP